MGRRWIAGAICAAVTTALGLSTVPPAAAAAPITVSGTVTDQFGDPVPGARVRSVVTLDRYWDEIFATTTADAEGEYTFTFSPRRWVRGEPIWADKVWADHAAYRADYTDLPDYLPGDLIDVDVTVTKRPTFGGVVTDPQGAPVAGAKVLVHNIDAEIEGCDDDDGCSSGYWLQDVLFTDAAGRFDRWSETYDEVAMVVTAPGFAAATRYGVRPGDELTIRLQVGDSAVPPVTVSGILRNVDGDPVAGQVTLRYYAWRYDSTVSIVDQATAGADGRFVTSVDPTKTRAWTGDLSVSAEVDSLRHAFLELDPGPWGLHEPGARYDIDLRVDAPATVTGIVTDEAGHPFAGVEVTGAGGPTTTTGPDGRYAVTTRPSVGGVIHPEIEFVAPGHFPERRYPRLPGGATFELEPVVLEAFPLPRAPRPPEVRVRGPHQLAVPTARTFSDLSIDARQARCRGAGTAPRTATRAVLYDHQQVLIVVTRLRPDHRYRCVIRSRNETGWGPWSRRSDPIRTPPVRR